MLAAPSVHGRSTESAAAHASFSNDTGSLTIGKCFDAVIWDDDLFTVVQDELLDTKVMTTFVDGQVAHGTIS
jgi:predicted amidohydrolase YtcJ